MKINRKEIIKSIIGESAKTHGFTLEWGTPVRGTWYILSLKREGLGQRIDFIEDISRPGELKVNGFDNARFRYEYDINDKESYRNIICQIKKFLETEGYQILDKRRLLPVLHEDDFDYISKNYCVLSELFCEKSEVDIDEIKIVDAMDLICASFSEIQGKQWDDIKFVFYEIVSFYIGVLLKKNKKLEISIGLFNEERTIIEIRRKDKIYVKMPFVEGLFGFWISCMRIEEMQGQLIQNLNFLFEISELKEHDIKVLDWKIANEKLGKG